MAHGWRGLVGQSVAPAERQGLHRRMPAARSEERLRVAAETQRRVAWLAAWLGCISRRCHAARTRRLGVVMAGVRLAASLTGLRGWGCREMSLSGADKYIAARR